MPRPSIGRVAAPAEWGAPDQGAAVAGGGVFGDHCSPLSDTSILASTGAASDHIDHVKTQIPYAFLIGLVSLTIYLLLGTTIL